jgi:hypothetical protein
MSDLVSWSLASGEIDYNVTKTPLGLTNMADIAMMGMGALGQYALPPHLRAENKHLAPAPEHKPLADDHADESLSCEQVIERLGPVPGESALSVLLRAASADVRKEALLAATSSTECTATSLLVREASRQLQQRPPIPEVSPHRSNLT